MKSLAPQNENLPNQPSARATAIQAIGQVRYSSAGFIDSDVWKSIIDLSWDDHRAPGDRRRLQARLREILDEVASTLPPESSSSATESAEN